VTDLAELIKLQQERATRKRSQLETLVSLYRDAQRLPFDPQELGFEFSAAEVKTDFDHSSHGTLIRYHAESLYHPVQHVFAVRSSPKSRGCLEGGPAKE
jgi:hypothetical protein